MGSCISITKAQLASTLQQLALAGQRRIECAVLWLGSRAMSGITVTEVFVPDQHAGCDIFRIPPIAMRKILRRLDEKGWFIAAQVHSHPREAFHSGADDHWAIVRHLDALSIVVPYFATTSSVENFPQQAAIFRLDQHGRWTLIGATAFEAHLKIL